jgi:hypothetical protein
MFYLEKSFQKIFHEVQFVIFSYKDCPFLVNSKNILSTPDTENRFLFLKLHSLILTSNCIMHYKLIFYKVWGFEIVLSTQPLSSFISLSSSQPPLTLPIHFILLVPINLLFLLLFLSLFLSLSQCVWWYRGLNLRLHTCSTTWATPPTSPPSLFYRCPIVSATFLKKTDLSAFNCFEMFIQI